MMKVRFEYNPKHPLTKQDMVVLDALLAKLKQSDLFTIAHVELIKPDGTRDSYDKWKEKKEEGVKHE